jgi:hypothetical protein
VKVSVNKDFQLQCITAGTWSEKRLKVIGQLCSASVSGVHRNEDREVWIHGNVSPFEDGPALPSLHCALQLDDLLGNHREHLDINSVELIKAKSMRKPTKYISASVVTYQAHAPEAARPLKNLPIAW